MNQIYNFSAGPSMLPISVLKHIKKELYNWNGYGISILEINHRNILFIKMIEEIEKNFRYLLNIPKNYKVLFCHGGARGQFSAFPLNLFKKNEVVDYIITGYWSKIAAKEGRKYCIPNCINISFYKNSRIYLKNIYQWPLTKESKYIHYCHNETIDGIAIHDIPFFPSDKIVIADYSSSILSAPIDISKFGLIYASAQKNIGSSGLTFVIIRDDLLGFPRKETPSILNYTLLEKSHYFYNTPPIFSLYLSGIMLKWIKSQGGLIKMEKKNKKKAQLLYNKIIESSFYVNHVAFRNRSLMNIPFYLDTKNLEEKFLKMAEKKGLLFLRGHRNSGGIRASLYNAMPIKGVQKLVNFMKEFEFNYK
ncbi:MAG: 3-phosphoserine/phosphohydroxythreonine transaminase [Arsenophonus sp.]|nr:MAG: 3-phosphoserine/phosphohydroxythreonine transaminase [Arsenophonus sp.]